MASRKFARTASRAVPRPRLKTSAFTAHHRCLTTRALAAAASSTSCAGGAGEHRIHRDGSGESLGRGGGQKPGDGPLILQDCWIARGAISRRHAACTGWGCATPGAKAGPRGRPADRPPHWDCQWRADEHQTLPPTPVFGGHQAADVSGGGERCSPLWAARHSARSRGFANPRP